MNPAHPDNTLKRGLQIVAWNASGVFYKIDELREFLDRHKPDVLVFSETDLVPGKNIRLPNYVLHRDDRLVRPGGGTAIAVKTSFSHHRVVLPPLSGVEATAVELPGVIGGLLVSAYKPPRAEVLNAYFRLFSQHTEGNLGRRP